MGGIENDVVVAKNLNFDQAAAKPHLGIINAAGKLPIGTGNLYPTPEILAGSLVSPNGSITIGYSSPNITIQTTASALDLHTARFIVSAGGTADGANFTTIAAALAAAALVGGNQTIFIQPGTYTENLTLSAGINLSAYTCDAVTPNVTIVGTLTATFAGTVTISGIRLQTNGAAILSITGTAATIVNFYNCYINATNATAITSTTTSTSSRVQLYFCDGDLGTTGIAYFSIAHGTMAVLYSILQNSGQSATQSTAANDSNFSILYSEFTNALSYSGSTTSTLQFSRMRLGGIAVIPITTSGTGTTVVRLSRIESDTQSSITVGAGTVLQIQQCSIDSSNTNAIAGAGTIQYSSLNFTNTSSQISTTTQVPQYSQIGKYRALGQPAFFANSAGGNDLTGDGTLATIGASTAWTEIYDQDSNFTTAGTFTAPVTGRYHFDGEISFSGLLSGHTQGFIQLTVSNRNCVGNVGNPFVLVGSSGAITYAVSSDIDMDAADTASLALSVSNSTKVVDVTTTANTRFNGRLTC